MSLKGAAYIVGAWEHPTRKATDKSIALLHAECAKGALDGRGPDQGRRGRLFLRRRRAGGLGPLSMVDYMNLKCRHVDSTDVGGSSYQVAVGHALEAIAAGRCNVALITLAGRPRSEGQATGTAPRAGSPAQPEMQFEYPVRSGDGEHVRDVRHAAHVRIRHHQRAARLDQGRRLASRAVQPARDAARRGHGRGRGELADGGHAAAPAGLLRHQRRRRRADRDQAGDRQKPEAAAGEGHRRRRGAEAPDGRRGRPDLLRRALVRTAGVGDGRASSRPTSNTPRSTTASPSPC